MEPTAVGRGRGSLHITGRICCARLHTTGSDLTSRPEDRVCICTSSDQAFVSTHPRTSLINHRHGFRNLLFFWFAGYSAKLQFYIYKCIFNIALFFFASSASKTGARRREPFPGQDTPLKRFQRAITLHNITHSC